MDERFVVASRPIRSHWATIAPSGRNLYPDSDADDQHACETPKDVDTAVSVLGVGHSLSEVHRRAAHLHRAAVTQTVRTEQHVPEDWTFRWTDDPHNKERYTFYFNTATIEHPGPDGLFDDNAEDLFQREPFMATVKANGGSFSLVLITIHTDPDVAVAEIGSLHDVVLTAKDIYTDEDEFIVLGDFNTGCSHASKVKLDELAIRGDGYLWIVPDGADTNLATLMTCAYDRIVVTKNTESEFSGDWAVDQAFTNSAVSDHWPVWGEFGVSEK